jgi:outer membrane lipoprotein LolB
MDAGCGAPRASLPILVRVAITSLALTGAFLAGCRTAPPKTVIGPGADAPWPAQRAALENLERYGLDGRVAVAAHGEGFSATLRYSQLPRGARFSLEGPMGIGGMRVEITGEDLEITTSRGVKLEGSEARAELERRLGFELPTSQLRWWLLGLPAPGEASIDADEAGQIRGFHQQGWRVSIQSRIAGLGFALPQRLTAERDGARLKLLVNHWLP